MTGDAGRAAPALTDRRSIARSLRRGRDIAQVVAYKVAELGLIGIISLVPLTFSFAADEVFSIPKVTVLRVLTLIMIAAFASFVALRGRVTLIDRRVSLPVIAYVAVLSVATIFSVSPTFSLYGNHVRADGLVTIANYIVVFFLAAFIMSDLAKAQTALTVAVATGAVVSALGIFQFFGGAPMGLSPTFGARAFSTIGNPDFLGTYTALLFPIALGLSLAARSGPRRILFAIAALLIALCLAFTLSRGAWLAFGASSLLLVVILHRELWHHRLLLASGAIIFVAAVAAAQLGYFAPVRQMIAQTSVPPGTGPAPQATGGDTALGRALDAWEVRDAGIRSRLGYWQGAIAVIMDRPLIGGGPNSFGQTFGRFAPIQYARAEGLDRFPDKVHNEILEAGVAAGIPGIISYLGVILSFLLLFRRWQGPRGSHCGILHASLLGTLVAYVTNTLFIFPTVDTGSQFWALMGIAAGTFGARGMRQLRFDVGRPGAVAIHLALAAFLVAGLQLATRPFSADVHFKAARGGGHLGGPEQIDTMRAAIALSPDDIFYYSQYAWLFTWKAARSADVAERRALLDEGAWALGEAIRKDPRNHQLYLRRGQLYSEYVDDHVLDALADFEKATTLYPNYYDAYASMAHLARSQGMYEEAIAADNRMLRIFPHDQAAFLGLSQDLFALGRYDEAIDVMQKALKFDPRNADLYYRLGAAFEATNQLEKARDAYSRALELDPGNTSSSAALGKLQKRDGNAPAK